MGERASCERCLLDCGVADSVGREKAHPLSEGVRSSEEEVELGEVSGEYACTSGSSAKRTCLRPWSWL